MYTWFLKIFLFMVETKFDFFEVEMKILSGNATILIKPMFSITPETFNPIYMSSPFWGAFVFAHHYMVPPHRKRSISIPVIGIVKTARLSMLVDECL